MNVALRIVGFMPFAATEDDGQAVLLRALTSRGCAVTPVLCDGLFSACDLHPGPVPRAPNACLLCQAGAAGRMAQWKMPYRWLGRWLAPDDTAAAGAWVASLAPQAYAEAAVEDWHLGAWVAASVQRHLGGRAPDVADPAHAMDYGSHLFSARLAAAALDRLYRDVRPHMIVVAEAQSGLARTALGLAAARNIPTHVVESDPAQACDDIIRRAAP